MIVRKKRKKYNAIQFNQKSKDHVYFVCKSSKNTGVELIDNNGEIYIHIDIPFEGDLDTTITKKVLYGNWVIIDIEDNIVVAVLNTEEFMNKFEPYTD